MSIGNVSYCHGKICQSWDRLQSGLIEVCLNTNTNIKSQINVIAYLVFMTIVIFRKCPGHNKKLEEAIISETSGNLKRLLVSMLQANRPEGNTIDRRKARNDAQALFDAGEKKFGTDESRFNVILCSRYYNMLFGWYCPIQCYVCSMRNR